VPQGGREGPPHLSIPLPLMAAKHLTPISVWDEAEHRHCAKSTSSTELVEWSTVSIPHV
jgi:hypothetical protein